MTNENDIMNAISEELQKLREGNSSPAQANAAANLTGKYLSVVKMKLEYNKMRGKQQNPVAFFLDDKE